MKNRTKLLMTYLCEDLYIKSDGLPILLPLPPARHLPHLTIASIRPTFPGINPDQEMRQCINKSYRAALITYEENPALREVAATSRKYKIISESKQYINKSSSEHDNRLNFLASATSPVNKT